jgi:hypothetical protein
MRSAASVERKPAQLVAKPLVVEHKLADRVGQLGALPLALQTAGRHAVVFSRCRPRGLDRVGRGSEFMGRHMAHRRSLAGSVRGMPCCATQVSGRGVRMAGRRAGLCPRDLTPRPCAPEVDRPTWTVVVRPCLLEVVLPVLRAVSRPHREKTMIVVLEDPAATHGDKPRIPDLGEDHETTHTREAFGKSPTSSINPFTRLRERRRDRHCAEQDKARQRHHIATFTQYLRILVIGGITVLSMHATGIIRRLGSDAHPGSSPSCANTEMASM